MVTLRSPIPGASYSDGYGPRAPIVTPGGTSGGFHHGQDFIAAAGTPVRAAAAGRVIAAGWIGTYGYAVYLDHGSGIVTRYAHLIAPPPMKVGDRVNAGGCIGNVGSTGASTGPHLHFEVVENGNRVDPLPYLTAPTPTPTPDPIEEDEDMWKPTVHVRTEGRTEATLAHPEIGADLAEGKQRKDGKVTVFPGYMVTTDAAVMRAWARIYAKGVGGETSRTNRADYVAIQAEATRVSVELRAD